MSKLVFGGNYTTKEGVYDIRGDLVKDKPISDSVILTRKEVEELVKDAVLKYGTKEFPLHPDEFKQQYINSII